MKKIRVVIISSLLLLGVASCGKDGTKEDDSCNENTPKVLHILKYL